MSQQYTEQEKLDSLMRSVQAGRIVHALLFAGPPGTGKRTAAARLAQSLVCTGSHAPCGVCPACRQFLSGSHPDVHRIAPEKGMIRIDAIRDLLETVALTPYSAKMHISIIEGADLMNPNSQNALLKTLETPTGQVMFILIAERLSGLLPTVISRCQMLRFSPLPLKDCAAALVQKGIPPEEAERLAALGQGSVGQALQIHGDEGYLTLRGQVLQALQALKDDASVLSAAQPLSGSKVDAAAVLDLLELWARDLMAVQNGAEPFERGEAAQLKKSRLNGAKLLQDVMQARRMIKANVALSAVMESLFFRALEHTN